MSSIAVVVGAGASRGLGGAIARRYAKGGLKVVISGRTQEKLDALADEIKSEGGEALPFVADATDQAATEALFEFAASKGTLKAVAHNVGNNAIIPFEDLEAKTFEQFWRICTLSGFLTAKAALPKLVESGGGSLIFTGASASRRGRPNFAHFGSAKAGLRNLAQALAKDYGPKGVHVGHVVVDGVINGEMVESRFKEYLDHLGEDGSLDPDAIAEAFWYMHEQPKSTWTFEVDVRPFKETW